MSLSVQRINIFREWIQIAFLHLLAMNIYSFFSLVFEQFAIKVIKLIRFIGTRHVVPVLFNIPSGQSSARGIWRVMQEVGVSTILGVLGCTNAELKLVDRTAGHSLMYSFDGSTSIGQRLYQTT